MLGGDGNRRLCAKPLLRTERVAHLHIRRRRLWQFRERVGQLFDGRRVQYLYHSNLGYGLLSLGHGQNAERDYGIAATVGGPCKSHTRFIRNLLLFERFGR